MKILRWIGIAVGVMVALALTLIAAAPTILSTSWGKNTCLSLASKAIPGTVELDSLSAGWFSGIELQGLKVKDPQGRQTLSCAHLALKKPLISLLFSQKDLGSITVESPAFICYAETAQESSSHSHSHSKGKEEKHEKQNKSEKQEPKPEPKKESQQPIKTPDVRAKIDVSGAQLIAMADGRSVGQLSNGTVALDLDLLRKSTGKVSGDLALSKSKPTPLALSFSLDGAPELSQMKGSFSFSCHGVPTELLAVLAQSINPQIADLLKEAFGSKLSYSVSATLTGPNVVLHSVLDSDNVRSDIDVHVQDSVATVSKGPLLTGTITPRLFNLLVSQNELPVTLLSPSSCAIENNGPLSVQLNPVRLTAPMDIRCSTKTSLALSFGSNKPSTTIGIDSVLRGNPEELDANININASTGSSSANLTVTSSAMPQDGGYKISTKTVLNGQWPTLIETISTFPCSSLIGNTLAGEVTLDGRISQGGTFSAQGHTTLSSEKIKEAASFTCTDSLISISEASFDASIPTSIIEKYAPSLHFQNPVGNTHISSTVKTVSVPLKDSKPLLTQAVVEATASVEVPQFRLQPDKGIAASLDRCTFRVTKEAKTPLAVFNLVAHTPVTVTGQPQIAALVGQSGASLCLDGSYNIDHPSVTVAKCTLTADRVSAAFQDLVVNLEKGLSATLSSPATIKVTADASLLPALPNGIKLEHPTDLSITVQPFSLTQTENTLKGSPIKAVLQTGDIVLAGSKALGPYIMSVPVVFDMTQHQIKADPSMSSGPAKIVTGTAVVHLPKTFDLPLLDNTTADCSLTVQQFPTTLLEVATSQPLSALIGESISSNISCAFTGLTAKGNKINVSGSGSFWKVSANCALDNMKLSSNGGKALEVEGTLSPAWVDALKKILQQKSDITIAQPVNVQFAVPSVSADLSSFLSKNGSKSIWELLETTTAEANLSTSALELKQASTTIGRLSPLAGNFDIKGNGHTIQFSVSAPAGGTPDSMAIAAKGSFEGLWNKQGMTLSSSHLRSTIDIDRFPTRVLDIIAPNKGGLLEEAIGKTIHLTGNVAFDELKSGSATLDLSAKNCSAHFDGEIQNGTLTLQNPASASLTITKDAGAALLKDVNPLLATAIRSEKPLKVTIDPHGTAIPLSPFSIAKVQIPKITADIGKIVVKNGGALKVILAILGMGDAANSEDLDVWLTPLYLKFQNGTLTCQRADALVANKLHMITWGDIDLGHDRINMVIAIPETSLALLHLQIMTPTPERGLQIPITGSTSHPDIDTKRATARIAGAGMMNNIPDKRLQMLGGLLQAAATAVGEPDQPIPPPTTSPFPWERR
jgi:hypothetical protein